ncbi:extensin [Burkholderia pseudomallei]|uniref:extensin n=1 Tax=Burkholderia pseudomallei TaxID=28450 RepID=UPI000AAF2F54|nr:extensin [Burkholderia pseudomallei]
MRAFGESPPPRSRAPLPQYAARARRCRNMPHGRAAAARSATARMRGTREHAAVPLT